MATTKLLRLLVVEDDEGRVKTFENWLEHLKAQTPPCEFRLVWAKSAGSAIGLLKRDKGRMYSGIMLDHDLVDRTIVLQDRLYTGKDVVEAVIENIDKDVPIMVHSANVTEAPKMSSKLEDAGFSVERKPFRELRYQEFRDWLRYVCESSE